MADIVSPLLADAPPSHFTRKRARTAASTNLEALEPRCYNHDETHGMLVALCPCETCVVPGPVEGQLSFHIAKRASARQAEMRAAAEKLAAEKLAAEKHAAELAQRVKRIKPIPAAESVAPSAEEDEGEFAANWKKARRASMQSLRQGGHVTDKRRMFSQPN